MNDPSNRTAALLLRTQGLRGDNRRHAIAQLALPKGQVWGLHADEHHGQVHWRGVSVDVLNDTADELAAAMVSLVDAASTDADQPRPLDVSVGQIVEVRRSGSHLIGFGAKELLGTPVVMGEVELGEAVLRGWIDRYEDAVRNGSTAVTATDIDGTRVYVEQGDTTLILRAAPIEDHKVLETPLEQGVDGTDTHGAGTEDEITMLAHELCEQLGGTLVGVARVGRRQIDIAEYDVVIGVDGYQIVVPVSLAGAGAGCVGVEPTHVMSDGDNKAREILAGALTAGQLTHIASTDDVPAGFTRLGANRFEAGTVARHDRSGICVLLRRA